MSLLLEAGVQYTVSKTNEAMKEFKVLRYHIPTDSKMVFPIYTFSKESACCLINHWNRLPDWKYRIITHEEAKEYESRSMAY